jgi:hypothetical protein
MIASISWIIIYNYYMDYIIINSLGEDIFFGKKYFLKHSNDTKDKNRTKIRFNSIYFKHEMCVACKRLKSDENECFFDI